MTKIHAGALYFAILVSIVIAVLSGLILTIALFYHKNHIHNMLYESLEYNADSGVNYLLTATKAPTYGEKTAIDLYDTQQDTVIYTVKDWGLYNVGIVYAVYKEDTSKRVFLYGALPDSIAASALYVADQGRPLMLAGKTLITGKSYLPEAGVKAAYVNGNYFTEKKLINGDIKKSGKGLPPVDKELISRIVKKANPATWKQQEDKYEITNDFSASTMARSFEKKTLVYYSPYPITVRRKTMTGNILLVSDTLISLEEDTELKDIIVYAPRVFIYTGVKGNVQVFAKDTLVIEKNTVLDYPSVAGLLEIDSVDNRAVLALGEGSTIKGTVFIYTTFLDRPQCKLVIPTGAVVTGQVYADGYTQMSGTIYGNLTCNKLLLKTDFATYENHLLDARIDYTGLSRYYTGSLLYKSATEKRNIKWLY